MHEKLRRQARKAAEKFADQEWPDVEDVFLDQVTSWTDPKGYSVWQIRRANHENLQYVRVFNARLQAEDWSL